MDAKNFLDLPSQAQQAFLNTNTTSTKVSTRLQSGANKGKNLNLVLSRCTQRSLSLRFSKEVFLVALPCRQRNQEMFPIRAFATRQLKQNAACRTYLAILLLNHMRVLTVKVQAVLDHQLHFAGVFVLFFNGVWNSKPSHRCCFYHRRHHLSLIHI